jgi:hypothetical protein
LIVTPLTPEPAWIAATPTPSLMMLIAVLMITVP